MLFARKRGYLLRKCTISTGKISHASLKVWQKHSLLMDFSKFSKSYANYPLRAELCDFASTHNSGSPAEMRFCANVWQLNPEMFIFLDETGFVYIPPRNFHRPSEGRVWIFSGITHFAIYQSCTRDKLSSFFYWFVVLHKFARNVQWKYFHFDAFTERIKDYPEQVDTVSGECELSSEGWTKLGPQNYGYSGCIYRRNVGHQPLSWPHEQRTVFLKFVNDILSRVCCLVME